MIISHSRKFIFVRTIKAGTSTLRLELARLCEPGDIITPSIEDNQTDQSQWFQFKPTTGPFVDVSGISRALTGNDNLTAAFNIFGEQIWDYKIIGCERNPFDRLISRYFWDVFATGFRQGTLGSKKQQVASLLDDRDAFHEYIRSARYFMPEGHDMYSLHGANVADFIVRQEHFAEDLEALAVFLGAPGELDPRTRIKAMPRTDDTEDKARLFDGIEDLVRARFLRTFEFMGYGGPGSDCPEFVPHENRHQVKRAYVDNFKGYSLTSGWRHKLRMEHPRAFTILRTLRYPGRP